MARKELVGEGLSIYIKELFDSDKHRVRGRPCMQTQSKLEQREVRGGHTPENRTWLHFVPRSNKYKYLHHTTNQDARRGDVEACSSAPK